MSRRAPPWVAILMERLALKGPHNERRCVVAPLQGSGSSSNRIPRASLAAAPQRWPWAILWLPHSGRNSSRIRRNERIAGTSGKESSRSADSTRRAPRAGRRLSANRPAIRLTPSPKAHRIPCPSAFCRARPGSPDACKSSGTHRFAMTTQPALERQDDAERMPRATGSASANVPRTRSRKNTGIASGTHHLVSATRPKSRLTWASLTCSEQLGPPESPGPRAGCPARPPRGASTGSTRRG